MLAVKCCGSVPAALARWSGTAHLRELSGAVLNPQYQTLHPDHLQRWRGGAALPSSGS
jgi:hypothetical protein